MNRTCVRTFWATSETCLKHTPIMCRNCPTKIPNKFQNVSRTCPKCVLDMSYKCPKCDLEMSEYIQTTGPRDSCNWAQGLLSLGPGTLVFVEGGLRPLLFISLLVAPLCAMLCPGNLVVGGDLPATKTGSPYSER